MPVVRYEGSRASGLSYLLVTWHVPKLRWPEHAYRRKYILSPGLHCKWENQLIVKITSIVISIESKLWRVCKVIQEADFDFKSLIPGKTLYYGVPVVARQGNSTSAHDLRLGIFSWSRRN